MDMLVIGRADVRELLDDETCIGLMRAAMIDLSAGLSVAVPRQIVPLELGMFGVMPGALAADADFGAKLISVYPGNRATGTPSHQGGVMLFDAASGAPVALVHAGEITAIRTAAASAAATDALARPDATRLAVLGYGEQAAAHVRAIRLVRPIASVAVWGRDPARAARFAERVSSEYGVGCRVGPDAASAVAGAHIVCTTTAAAEPILFARDLSPGAHVNLVGSSYAGPVEVDTELVAAARFFGDHRPHVLAQGAEFVRARDEGRITDAHFLAEIGQVLAGEAEGRTSPDDITIYKSLGHIVQDLASARHVYARALAEGQGGRVAFG